jgi:hypothetical protein
MSSREGSFSPICRANIFLFRMNLGHSRYIPRQKMQGLKVHRSVKMRMETEYEDGSGKYKPRAELLVNPIWID